MYKFFRYSGSKDRFSELITKHINTEKRVYCEPFVGSGGILFNLDKYTQFDRFVINDLDKNIIQIYKSFKEIDFMEYTRTLEYITKEFGEFIKVGARYENIEEAKQNYYTFRKHFNDNFWGTGKVEEGIYLHVLQNSCINSFLRFGPNGMNQGFGYGTYTLNEENFNHIKKVLRKTEIHCGDYRDVIDKDYFHFFDPPYASQDSSYAGFTMEDLQEFINCIDGLEFLYTDILNDVNSQLQNRIEIRKMRSTQPNSRKQTNNNSEMLFSSSEFAKEHNLLDW